MEGAGVQADEGGDGVRGFLAECWDDVLVRECAFNEGELEWLAGDGLKLLTSYRLGCSLRLERPEARTGVTGMAALLDDEERLNVGVGWTGVWRDGVGLTGESRVEVRLG